MQLNSDDNKIELHVSRDNPEEVMEIDLVNVFINMGKKAKVYAWLLIACMLLGLTVPLCLAQAQRKGESVSTVLSFTYEGADQEYAPGEAQKLEDDPTYEPVTIDVNEIKSSYVLRNALSMARLSKNIPIAAIEGNVVIERLLTDESRQSIEVANMAMEADKKNYMSAVNIVYEYSGKYAITLNNGFTTDSRGRNKVYLSTTDMSSLLNCIVESYNEYFFKTYMSLEFPANKTEIIKDDSLDFIERLDEMVTFLDALSDYCTDETKGEYLTMSSKADGLSLSDINDCIKLVHSANVDYLYSYVFYNSVAKSNDSMVTRYEYLARELKNETDALNGTIANNSALLSEYRNDEIVINLSEQGVGEVSEAATDYYNDLILEQAANYEKAAELQIDAENLQDKLNGLTVRYSYPAQVKFVEDEINSLAGLIEKLYILTEEHAQEIMESESYKTSFMTSIDAQYTASSLLNKATVKKMLIGFAAGAFGAVVIWGCDALGQEFMRGRKKEEEEAAV